MPRIRKSANRSKGSLRLIWLGLLVVLIIGLIIVIAPIWIIQPFKAQTTRGLEVSLTMKRISPTLTIVASLAFALLAALLWNGARWFGKVFLVLLAIPSNATQAQGTECKTKIAERFPDYSLEGNP